MVKLNWVEHVIAVQAEGEQYGDALPLVALPPPNPAHTTQRVAADRVPASSQAGNPEVVGADH